jgi:general secretion pathway protein A
MDAYKYFHMSSPPFEARPDPRYFLDLPVYAEALATLQYTVRAGKSCAVIVGESGAGKTLLARVLGESVNRSGRVLWIHGIGQPEDCTEITCYPPGAMANARNVRAREEHTTLAQWLRNPTGVSPVTLVVVDNADALHKQNWTDLMALLTRDVRGTRTLTVAIFGTQRLLERLGSPRLERMRRRVFRTCSLSNLSREQTESYINHRLRLAGARRSPFTREAIDRIHQYARGTPGTINHLCDNALIDAFGDDRDVVRSEHVHHTVRAIAGAWTAAGHALPAPSHAGELELDSDELLVPGIPSAGPAADERDAPARSSRFAGLTKRLAQVTRTVAAQVEDSRELLADPATDFQDPGPGTSARSTSKPHTLAAAVRQIAAGGVVPGDVDTGTPAADADGDVPTTADRLKSIESRINSALDRVRNARNRKARAKATTEPET